MVDTADAGKKQLALVRDSISVGVGQNENIGRIRNDRFVAQDTNTQRRVDARVLIKRGLLVGASVPICIFEDDDAVTLRLQGSPRLGTRPVVYTFIYPNATS